MIFLISSCINIDTFTRFARGSCINNSTFTRFARGSCINNSTFTSFARGSASNLISGNHPNSMDNTWNVTKNGQQDIDQKIFTNTSFQKHP